MNIEKKNEILSKAYKDSQTMISLADSKANISLTIQSLLITLALGFSLLSNIFEKINFLIENNYLFAVFYLVVMIILIGLSIAGIITTILVFKPRESKEASEKKREGYFYFGHVSKYNSSDDYFTKIQKLNEEDLLEEYSRQIYQLSLIAEDKFKYLKFSIYFLIINMGFTILFLILSSIVSIS
ncbi:MAG: Pycsar system effector family protein [Candidatus Thorarchaeota archaeon]